jgi:hypothetical protein
VNSAQVRVVGLKTPVPRVIWIFKLPVRKVLTSLWVRHSLSRQPRDRRVLCVQRDFWYGRFGSNTVYLAENLTFRRKISQSSSVSKSKPTKRKEKKMVAFRSIAQFKLEPVFPDSCLPYTSTLKMELCSSETSDSLTTWRHIPEDRTLNSHRRNNLRSNIIYTDGTWGWLRRTPSCPCCRH